MCHRLHHKSLILSDLEELCQQNWLQLQSHRELLSSKKWELKTGQCLQPFLRHSLNTKLTCCWSRAGRGCYWRGVGPAQTQQGRHAATSLGPSAWHVVAVSWSLPLVLRASHKLIRLVDHHALREEWGRWSIYMFFNFHVFMKEDRG